jgi:hypothetical protein
MRGTISKESWQKGLEQTRDRERAAAERAKTHSGQVTIATEYTEMADRAERERLTDEASERQTRAGDGMTEPASQLRIASENA